MIIGFNAHLLKAAAEGFCSFLTGVMGNYNAANHEAAVLKFIAKAENVLIVGDSKVAANLVFFNINC